MWGRIQRFLDRFESRIALAQIFGFTGGSGVVSGYTASVTEWFAVWGPISWVFAGLLGMLAAVSVLAVWGWSRAQVAKARYQNSLVEQPKTINPLARNFSELRIKLNDLSIHGSLNNFSQENKTFTDCVIIGPGTAGFINCNVSDNKGVPGCNFVKFNGNGLVQPDVFFVQCNFIRCVFLQITAFIHEDAAETATQAIGPIKWVLE